jgi:hypothetical protein|tara:strand:- start:641 stop:748 length:108 start_codon:yes stop_codon:yes gene_type:complete
MRLNFLSLLRSVSVERFLRKIQEGACLIVTIFGVA